MIVSAGDLLLILMTLALSAFFSGVEIAFVAANKLQIELQRKQGHLAGRVLSRFVKEPSRFIGTLLVGNTIMLSLYGILMARLLEPVLKASLPAPLNQDTGVLFCQTVISTLIVLPVAEFLPKSTFLINPNRMLTVLAIPIRFFDLLLSGLVWIIVGLSKSAIRNVFRLRYAEDQIVYGLTDLNNYLKELQQPGPDDEITVNARIFSNAVEFKTVRVRECMLPRTDIVAIDAEDGLSVLRQTFIDSGHSKVLVYKESIDNIVGYCHSSAVFRKPNSIHEIISPITIVPETMLANELLIQFISERRSIALVVDEFGGTSGIVTIEDLMEEIFGEIRDEHDEHNLLEEQIDERTYHLSARLEVDYLNEKYDWSLPEGDYDTLGGLILAVHEDIPQANEVIDAPPFTFTILTMEDARIDTVQLSISDADA